MLCSLRLCFFLNCAATSELYTLSLHDALPISLDAAVSAVSDPEKKAERTNNTTMAKMRNAFSITYSNPFAPGRFQVFPWICRA
mgnify:CR=1 FL=1